MKAPSKEPKVIKWYQAKFGWNLQGESLMNNIKLKKFNKWEKHNDELIVQILKTYNKPIDFEVLHVISGLSKSKLSQVLRSLQKYKIAKKIYCRKTSYWVYSDNKKLRSDCNANTKGK